MADMTNPCPTCGMEMGDTTGMSQCPECGVDLPVIADDSATGTHPVPDAPDADAPDADAPDADAPDADAPDADAPDADAPADRGGLDDPFFVDEELPPELRPDADDDDPTPTPDADPEDDDAPDAPSNGSNMWAVIALTALGLAAAGLLVVGSMIGNV